MKNTRRREYFEQKPEFNETTKPAMTFDLIREWRKMMEAKFTEDKDVSAWALFCICENRSPFKDLEIAQDPSLNVFIILISFAIEMALSSEKDIPSSDVSPRNWHLSAVRPNTPLAQLLHWSGQSLNDEADDHIPADYEQQNARLEHEIRGRRGTWIDLLYALRVTLGVYREITGAYPGDRSTLLYAPVSVSMALLGITLVPCKEHFEWNWSSHDSFLWPGLVNVKALAAYRSTLEAEVTSRMARQNGLEDLPALWDSFLIIVDDRWEQYQYARLRCEKDDKPHWKYVKTSVPALLGRLGSESEIEERFDDKQLRDPGLAGRDRCSGYNGWV